MTSSTKILVNPSATSVERDADLTAVPNGAEIFNSTESRLEYTTDGGTSWKQIASVSDVPVDTTAYGECFFQDNATETVIAVAATPVQVAGTYVTGDLLNCTHATGTLTYTATDTKQFLISLSLTATLDLSTANISVIVYKNGSPIAKSKQSNFTGGTSPGFQSTSVNALTSLATNDTIEVFIQNDDTTSNITVKDLNISLSTVGGMVGAGDDQVVTSWDGSTASTAVTAGTDIDITGGVISYNGTSGDNVVTAWDGSATPVAVTSGTGIDITGGVISSTAQPGGLARLLVVTKSKGIDTEYLSGSFTPVWDTFIGSNTIAPFSFAIGETIEINCTGNITSTVNGGTCQLQFSYGGFFSATSQVITVFSGVQLQENVSITAKVTRISSTEITASLAGWFGNNTGNSFMRLFEVIINPYAITFNEALSQQIALEWKPTVPLGSSVDLIAKNMTITKY